MKDSIYAVVVVYNISCSQSKTCQCLTEQKDINVMVMDNSTRDYQNEQYCLQQGWSYYSMQGNKGLAKAYNRVLDELDKKQGIVVWFDDDTIVPKGYFNELSIAVQNHPEADIFVPKIYDEKAMLSPCLIKGYSVSRLADADDYNSLENLTAINTGMACRLSLFEHYRYDERYFLDCIDHAFIRDMKKRGHNIFVFNTKLAHRFSDNIHDNKQADMTRFKIFARDFALFCSNDIAGRCFYIYKMLARGFKLCLLHKSIAFLLFGVWSVRLAFKKYK